MCLFAVGNKRERRPLPLPKNLLPRAGDKFMLAKEGLMHSDSGDHGSTGPDSWLLTSGGLLLEEKTITLC